MKECKFCKKHLDDNEMTCGYCGYDFKTGAMDPSFDPNKPNKKTRHKNGGVSPVIKKFATIGILILVVSLTYKYMFNIKAVVVDFLSSATQDALGKGKGTLKAKTVDNKPQKMELRDVRFYEKEDKAGKYKDLKVEGIFFDPSGKSFVTINGKVLSEGESINGIEIEKIYSDSVELKVKDETKVLGVNQSMPFETQNAEEKMTGKNPDKNPAVESICELPLNDEDLKKLLTPEQYRITRQNGTETAFNNEYWNNKRQGIYVDVVSGEPLFSSTDKFDSETGWPSFTSPIDKDNIVEKKDSGFGMVRTEVRSKNSNSHLGHLFEDGPQPTGLRYCINSAALRFISFEDLDKEGYRGYAYLFTKPKNEIAVFGAGCFWGVQSILSELDGVLKVTAGYMGGITKNPTYEDVCTDKTGYAEVVEVEYDPKKISYQQLLNAFWSIHDPTSVNRQGPDVGTQYRSVIFYYTLEQKKASEASKVNLKDNYKEPIATEILAARAFYKAEEYHQDYFKKHNLKPTCNIPLKKK